MATRQRHNAILLMVKETEYGTAVTTPTDKFPDQFVPNIDYNKIQLPYKTQTLEPQAASVVQGRQMHTFQTTGYLTASHGILFEAFFSAATYALQTSDGGYSYTIYYAYPASSSDAGDGFKCTGCRLQDLVLSKDGEFWRYTATWRAKEIDPEQSLDGLTLTTITDTTAPEELPCLFQYTTCDLLDDAAVAEMLDMTVELHNIFASDDVSFTNNQDRQRDVICGVNCKISGRVLYDTVKDATVYDNIWGSLKEDKINILDGDDEGFNIVTWGKYAGYTLPDEDMCLYETPFEKEIYGNSSNTAITVTET